MRRIADRCMLLWPHVCNHTSNQHLVRPPREREDNSTKMGWSTKNPGKESQSQGALVAKNRQKRRSTETEEIIIPAPGGRPSHPPTHNTSTTSPWSQYPSPLQSGIKFTTSSHLTPLVPSTSKARLPRIKEFWVVRIPQRVKKKKKTLLAVILKLLL